VRAKNINGPSGIVYVGKKMTKPKNVANLRNEGVYLFFPGLGKHPGL
jgi:hypothetical protein